MAKSYLLLSLLLTTHLAASPNIHTLTLREKVGQLFNIRLENLCDSTRYMTAPPEEFYDNYRHYPCGFFSLFAHNITDSAQLLSLTSYLHALPLSPLLCIDEEGGRVARIGRNPSMGVPAYSGGMREIGDSGNTKRAHEAGLTIGGYLRYFGLDINYAPLADACLQPDSSFLSTRLFGGDALLVGQMDTAFMHGLREQHVAACYKHFPGHGNALDTHRGAAVLARTEAEMRAYELLPFRMGIADSVPMMMVAHLCVPAMTGDSLPATLSPYFMQTLLREEMGYRGLIITDGLEMKAITSRYDAGEAAVQAFLAGADILMLPADYRVAFDAMLEAVESGRIPLSRLDESVARILALKAQFQP